MKNKTFRVVGISLLVCLSAFIGVKVYASITNSQITACVKRDGSLHIVSAGTACARGENLLTWNITGPKGDKGDTGAQGPKGDTGTQGPIGVTGLQGIQGDKGDRGEQGPVGPVGAQGAPGTTPDGAVVGPIGPVGATGAKGEPGEPGPAGVSRQIIGGGVSNPCSGCKSPPYFSPASGSYSVEQSLPVGGTLSHFSVHIRYDGGLTSTSTFTVLRNNISTPVTCSITYSDTLTNRSCNDITHSMDFNEDDTLSVLMTNTVNSGYAWPVTMGWTAQYQY